eukprot:jgi/Botrbrau1/9067/Bobra.0376s0037.1
MDGKAASQETDLDLTNAHLSSLDDVELPQSLTNLDLTANRLRAIPDRLLNLTGLSTLCLRQNVLKDAGNISESKSAPVLRELSLQDNCLRAIPDLSKFAQLRRLEISYNEIQSLEGVQVLNPDAFEDLYAANNLITQLQGLSSLRNLRLLDVGSNKIRSMDGVGSCMSLKELWLGRNRIDCVMPLDRLSSLEKLSLQSNRLESTMGIEMYHQLQELYLSHNGITALQGLESLTKLQILDVGNNGLTAMTPLTTLTALREIWINDNRLDNLNAVLSSLEVQRLTLKCIYLNGNLLAADGAYKAEVRNYFPKLEQLDADYLLPISHT